jgi:hypothetical protein
LEENALLLFGIEGRICGASRVRRIGAARFEDVSKRKRMLRALFSGYDVTCLKAVHLSVCVCVFVGSYGCD